MAPTLPAPSRTRAIQARNPAGDSTLIRFLLTCDLNDTPSTHYAYSNVGYLGFVC
ncbi:hypothetical protein [Hymenobacter wooponensis]|uniref:hypothetical protein n=1 Tax=Hymenobacter wooponensis TaxID=1525360 RepID=UPI0014368DE9|nr:hypothetical protein [Hymenobacter wooponensis]